MAKWTHDYSDPDLNTLIAEACAQWRELINTLHSIQEATGIPGLHTNINSDDPTPGVLERIQDMYDSDQDSLAAFKEFDNDD
jgi:hypothetical protein